MGLFGRNNNQPQPQQFGVGSMGGMGGMGMMQQQPMGWGQDPTAMMAFAQNPMMQQQANDPVIATSRLLGLHDPVSAFVVTQNMGLVMDLISEVVMLSLKEFFAAATLKQEGDHMKVDFASMPHQLQTLSQENLALTLQQVQQAAQSSITANQQQIQMFLMAHQQGGMMPQQQQPGFFGNLIGGMMGNAIQTQGGFGATAAKVGGAAGAVMI